MSSISDKNTDSQEAIQPKAELTLVAGDELAAIAQVLKSARASKSLNLNEISSDTHIPKRYLAALESQDYEQLPEQTYVLGYLRSYSAYLEIDGDELVHKYKKYQQRELAIPELDEDSEGAKSADTSRAAVIRSVGLEKPAESSQFPSDNIDYIEKLNGVFAYFYDNRGVFAQPKVYGPLLLILLFVAVQVFQEKRVIENESIEQVKVLANDGSLVVERLPATADEPRVVRAIKTTTVQNEIPKNTVKIEALSAAESNQVADSELINNEFAGNERVLDQDKLRLTFSGESWVTIRDYSDEIIHNAGHPAADEFELIGTAPFHVKLGHGPSVELEFQGESVDFSKKIRSSSKTAEFTLNP